MKSNSASLAKETTPDSGNASKCSQFNGESGIRIIPVDISKSESDKGIYRLKTYTDSQKFPMMMG